MLCEKCHKNEASVSIKTIIDGVVENRNLCTVCANKEGLFQTGFAFDSIPMSNYIGQHLFSFPFETSTRSRDETAAIHKNETKCLTCGESLSDFKQTGLFGCSECYQTYRDLIRSMLDEIQGAHKHLDNDRETLFADKPEDKKRYLHIEGAGKDEPGETRDVIASEEKRTMSEREQLKNKLEKLVKEENYEEAALVRDKIKALSKSSDNNSDQNLDK